MFDIGFWEFMVISILALVVIGPERLPKVAKTAGHWFGKTRRFVEGVKSEVESEFDATELKRLMHNQEVQIKELQSKLNEEAGDFRKGFSYNLDEDTKDDQATNQAEAEDDYLEFLDEDEEKDHEQIAAEKLVKENLAKEALEQEQEKARSTRKFENPAVAEQSNQESVAESDTSKQKEQHDG